MINVFKFGTLVACLGFLTGCFIDASITKLDPATSDSDGRNFSKLRVYFQTQTVTLTEGSFGLFNILSEEKVEEDVRVDLFVSGPSGRIQVLPSELIIPKGQMSTAFTIQSIEDSIYQGDATYTLSISSADAKLTIDPSPMVIQLLDNDQMPTLNVANVSVAESAGSAIFTLSLNRLNSQDVQVSWMTANGSALAGVNFTQSSGVATIPAGVLSTTVSVPVINTPAICELDRVFSINFSNAVKASLGTSQATGTITEDDFPTISITNATTTEGSIGAMNVSLSQSCPNHNVTVGYTMTDGTATSADYVGQSGTLTIPAGQTSKLLGITTLDDALVESTEIVNVALTNPTYSTLASGTATLTILDDDVSVTSTNNLSAISTGGRHTCAIKNGGAYCWGINGAGELGNGTLSPSYLPIPVSGLGANVTQIVSAGISMQTHTNGTDDRTCAIVSGAAKCWGHQSSYGELGNGSSGPSSVPVNLIGLGAGVSDISISSSGGSGFGCAVHDGAAKCWGRNYEGQLGLGSTDSGGHNPSEVTGLGSGVIAISTGQYHACAILSGGTVQCWGKNDFGQLGNNTTIDSLVPVPVSGIPNGATKISAGRYSTCALVSGSMKCWGRNHGGQLGDGTYFERHTPVDVLGLGANVQDIKTASDDYEGYAVSCAVLSPSGAVKCWGTNGLGQLGDGTTTSSNVPVQVQGLTSGFTQVSVSPIHACALKSDGKSFCWGDFSSGQLGNNKTAYIASPKTPIGMETGVTAVAAGFKYGCAIQNGSLKCWGYNSYGNLGNGNYTAQANPVQVLGLSSGVTSVGVMVDSYTNDHHTCAVHLGAAKCWGANGLGELGNGTTGGSFNVPVAVSGLGSGVRSVAVSTWYSCAVLLSGGLKCWGNNSSGQLGNNSTINSNVPVDVIGITNATSVALGMNHACAIDGDALKCWGANASGQLGNGTTINSLIPIIPTGMSAGVTSVSALSYGTTQGFTCAVVSGSAKCWGHGFYGTLGVGDWLEHDSPTQVLGFASGVQKVTTHNLGGCLLTLAGAVHCWGQNAYSILAPGFTSYSSPFPIAQSFATTGITDLTSGGGTYACAITTAGTLKCWGRLADLGIGELLHPDFTDFDLSI